MEKAKVVKVTAIGLSALMILTSLTACKAEKTSADTVEQEFYLNTTDKNRSFEGEFPSEITLDGKTYRISAYSDIKFEDEGSEEMVEFWQEVNVEDKSEIPQKADFDYNGNKVTADLSETYLEEGAIRKTITTTADYSDYVSSPTDVPETTTVTVDMPDGTTKDVEGHLASVEQVSEYEWRDNLRITGVWIGDPSAEEYVLEGTDISVPYNAEYPTWAGYQTDILSAMGLSSDYYRIEGGEWADEGTKDANGNFVRHATYYGSRYVANFLATYTCSYDTYGWSGRAAYRVNADKLEAPEKDRVTVYKLKAVVKYSLVEAA